MGDPRTTAAQDQPGGQPPDANVTRARELFELGVQTYDRGVYFEALRYFQEAYQLRPHPLVRVNIANCYEKLDRPAEAILNFELFLASNAGTPAQQKEVRDALAQLRRRVGRLVLSVSPEGARVVIDGKDERRAPISDALLLKAGRHQITASLEGHETAMRVVDVAGEGISELTIALTAIAPAEPTGAPPEAAAAEPAPPPAEPAPEAAAEPLPAPPILEPLPSAPAAPSESAQPPALDATDSQRGGLPTLVWLTGGATFAALMSAIVTGQLALSADREFNGDLAAVRNSSLTDTQRASAWAQGIDSADRAQSFAVATDVLLSVALAGAVLTTVFYVDHRSEPTEVTASVGPGQAGLQLSSRF